MQKISFLIRKPISYSRKLIKESMYDKDDKNLPKSDSGYGTWDQKNKRYSSPTSEDSLREFFGRFVHDFMVKISNASSRKEQLDCWKEFSKNLTHSPESEVDHSESRTGKGGIVDEKTSEIKIKRDLLRLADDCLFDSSRLTQLQFEDDFKEKKIPSEGSFLLAVCSVCIEEQVITDLIKMYEFLRKENAKDFISIYKGDFNRNILHILAGSFSSSHFQEISQETLQIFEKIVEIDPSLCKQEDEKDQTPYDVISSEFGLLDGYFAFIFKEEIFEVDY